MIVKNILEYIKQTKLHPNLVEPKLKASYHPMKINVGIASLGTHEGVFQFGPFVFGNIVMKYVKRMSIGLRKHLNN